MSRSRLFVGWRVPEDAVEALAPFLATLRAGFERDGGRARWEARSKLHATLHFLGDTDDERVPALGAALAATAARHTAFEVVFSGVGTFPPRGAPRIVFAAVGEGAEALCALAEDVQRSLVEVGAAPPDKPFHPHVTLGRAKSPPRRSWRPPGGIAVRARVAEVALYRSVLGSAGSTHTALRTAPLTAMG